MKAGWSGAEKGQGAVQPTINTAGMPAAEMACGIDPSTSSWKNGATDVGSVVSGGGSDKAEEGEDVLSAIAGSGGGSGSIANTRGG